MLRSAAIPLAAILGAGAGSGYLIQSPWIAHANPPAEEVDLLGDCRVPTRAQQVARLRHSSKDDPFDVLIIGGGATGTGCALDAATRCVGALAALQLVDLRTRFAQSMVVCSPNFAMPCSQPMYFVHVMQTLLAKRRPCCAS